MEKVIAIIRVKDLPRVWDFLKENETEEEALKRGQRAKKDNLNLLKRNHKLYERVLEDGTEYWQNQIDLEKQTEYKIMTYEEFKKCERDYILSQPITEITKDYYYEQLDVLPPLSWTTHNNIEVFCMSEFYTASFTMQYAHDKRTDKYYSKLVDYEDKSMWLCEIL